jgi:uncharacterized membrane protein
MTAAAGIHGRIFELKRHDLPARFVIVLLALFILFYPRGILSIVALIPALFIIFIVTRRTEKATQ